MHAFTARLTCYVYTLRERFSSERGDGPTDNSILIAVGAGAAATLGAAVVAAVAKAAGAI